MKKLYLLIICAVLSIGARAQFSGSGNGTENDPYLIFNPTQLSQMGNFLGQSGVVFELKNDIDLTEFINDNYPSQGWLPIGTQNSHFKGILKGNNHSIRGLVVNRPSSSYIGLFGYLEGATVNDLTISGSVFGSEYVGLLAGYASSVTVQGCTMNIEGDNHVEANNVGGLFGYIDGGGTLSNNTVNGNIRANSNVGGFIGRVAAGISFSSCYHNGNVSGSEAVGGIVGYLNGNVNTTFNGCRNNGTLYNTGNYTGGIVGKSEGYAIRGITNCSQFGNINGVDYVGGLVGYNVGDQYKNSGTYNIKNCLCVGDINGRDFVGGLYGVDHRGYYSNIYYYYYTDILDCYYNGNISGRNNVGGLVGHKLEGTIRNCYSHATVIGASNVGGLVGHAENITLKACVAYNTKISSTDGNRGRIYGKCTGGSLGELGSAEGNISYNQTSVVQSGVVQEVLDDQQNGTTVGPSLLRLMATYVAKGWDFNNDWIIQETECLPYKRYQAAPPVIESNLSSNETTISGKSINGGTVYLYYKDYEAVSQECVGHNWSFSTEQLQSGAQVRIYADVDGLTPSYLTTTNVSFPGSGTEADPYRIYTASDLQGVSKRGYYKVMNDIDLTSWIEENSPTGGWVPVGRTGAEATYIDGNGYTISGLWINSTEDWTGLFSNFDSGRIKNLTVNTAEGKKVKGGNYTGILIGRNSNGKIQNCVVNGTVEGTGCVGAIAGLSANDEITQCRVQANVISTSANAAVGGAFGQLEGGKMTKVLANVTISASGASSYVGGLVGAANADISQTVSTGVVTSTGNGTYTGGLIGQNRGTVVNSYSTVTTTGTEYTAGLVGYSFGTIDHCYAKGDIKGVKYGAGVVGVMDGTSAYTKNSAAVNDKIILTDQSAWGSRVIGGYKNGTENPDNSNLALNTMQVSMNNVPQKKYDDLVEGRAKTQAELQSLSTYQTLGWDMTTVWSIDEGETYPYLLWEIDINPVADITLDKTDVVVAVGNEATLTASILPLSATNKRLAWTTSNKNIATVDNGVVTAVSIGEATITATSTDGSNISAACRVTVVANHDEAIAELRSLVNDALALYNNSTEGDEIGQYQPGARAALLAVINEVRSKITDTMDESEISECTSKLNTAINTFKSQQVSAGEDTDITLLDNVIYIEPFEAASGQSVTISVKMKNSASIQGYQFDLYLPEGVTVATDEDGFALAEMSTARTTKNKTDYFGSNFQKDGSFRVLCGSTKGYTFSGNDGEVCKVTLNIAEGLDEGELPIILKNITTTSNTNVGYDTPYVKTTLTISSFTLGDVNSDTQINITDFTSTANYILGYEPAKFVKKAADFNTDDIINVTDLMALANYILSGGPSYAPKRLSAPRMAASASDNYIYVEPLTASRGGQATISVKMKNTENIQGYQLDMYLPEGISFATDADGFPLAEMSTERTTTQKTDYFGCNFQADGALRLLCGSTKGYTFSGNDGEIARVTINVADDAQLGDLPLILRTLTVTTNQNVGYDTPSYETTITVKSDDVEYAEGYSLQIIPFESNAGTVHELVVNFNQKEENIEEMEFEVVAPDCMSRTKNGRVSKAPVFCNNERIYTDDHSIEMTATDNGFKVVVKALTNDEYRVIAGTEGSLITLFYTSNSTAEDGLYKFQIKNIKMTTSDGDVIDVVPYTASVLMGEPVFEGDIEMYGNYSASAAMTIANKVASNVGVTAIDMSEITAINNRSSLTLANPNALVYLPEEMSISNSKNVVVGDECENLVLTDGGDFYAPKAFTAVSANYNLAVSASLGYKTLVLPFDWSVPVSHNAYEVTGVNNGELEMSQVYAVNANTPVIVENAGSALINATNVTIAASGAALTCGELIGTYEKMNAPTGSYVLQNQGGEVAFYLVGEEVHPAVGAFRAYLKGSNGGARRFALRPGVATGISNVNADSSNEYYNLAGQRVEKSQRGINIIRSNDGVKKIVAP